MTDEPRIEAFGDSGVLLTLEGGSTVERARRVHRLAQVIRTETGSAPGWSNPIPAAASVLVPVDPLEPGVDVAIERLRSVLSDLDDVAVTSPEPQQRVEIPTRYGGVDGPDLAALAAARGLTEPEAIELHASVDYDVLFLGFAPGFAYLGDVPEAIAMPRLATPRTRVPAGSVAIAGRQTAVYPFESPGGWQLIGRTDVRLWDVDRESPALLTPGDVVRFVPV
ncbi:MAG TPA: 5-oxoprolinase subunit PxpB [Candidatus Polarisedimenticolia bacterium]|nr:5-oxoprolinase subunit PxpB [Candidatus Polarisedimenticolia bacterium]